MVETGTTSSWWRTQLQIHHHRRWISTFFTTRKTLLAALWIAFFFTVFLWQQRSAAAGFSIFRRPISSRAFPRLRPVAFNLTDFGAVGDGVTVNTAAFERAMMAISKRGKKGGGQLNVPPGYWLTAPFNLTSHLTLFLAEGAEILGININKHYLDFQHPNSADLVMQWDKVMDGKHATSDRAQFSAQPPPQYVPSRVRRRRRDSDAKEKSVASSSVIDPPHHFLPFDDDGCPVARNPGKRSMSSGAYNSEKDGSRGSKSQQTRSNNY